MNDGKDAASLRELGNRYREGDGVEKDPSRAAELLSEEGFPDEVVSAGPAGRSLPKRNEPEGDEGYVVISGEGA